MREHLPTQLGVRRHVFRSRGGICGWTGERVRRDRREIYKHVGTAVYSEKLYNGAKFKFRNWDTLSDGNCAELFSLSSSQSDRRRMYLCRFHVEAVTSLLLALVLVHQ
jgi:hypothetical protein